MVTNFSKVVGFLIVGHISSDSACRQGNATNLSCRSLRGKDISPSCNSEYCMNALTYFNQLNYNNKASEQGDRYSLITKN